MNWESVGARAIGTAHVESSTPCQDQVWAGTIERQEGACLLLTVADGAGSAACAEQGAERAVQAVHAYLQACTPNDLMNLDESLSDGLIDKVRADLTALANGMERPLRDFACTLLAVVSNSDKTLALQIGDGGIVVDVGNGAELAISPMGGEYVNITRFITDDDAALHVETRLFAGAALRAAVFSDGLQRLALDLAGDKPHEPFFRSFFGVLEAVNDDNRAGLAPALERFLNSEQVNARTDDDKAMALALLRS